MSDAPEHKGKGFIVGPDGSAIGGAAGSDGRDADDTDAAALPPADFATFVLSLGSSVMIHLGLAPPGLAPRPEGASAERNLPMAKHTIDLLAILRDKTAGNLTSDERDLLEAMLYDLQLRFVTAQKS